MTPAEQKSRDELLLELDELTLRLQEAEETLEAIRSGGVDALVVAADSGQEQLYTLDGADRVYRVFLESISQGALTLSGDGLILFANEAAGRLLSAKTEVVVGARLRSFVRAADRGRFDALLENGLVEPVNAEVRVRGRKGGRALYLSLHPLRDRGDRMVVAVLSDLSGQKRTEAALEAEGLARAVFEQAGEAIVVCDKDGLVIRASRAAVRLTGRQPLFHSFDDVLPLCGADGSRVHALRRSSGSKPLKGQEVRFDREDGRSFSLILIANPLKTREHGHVGQVVTLADVTQLKQAEEAREKLVRDLEKANRELATIESLSRAGLQLTSIDQLAHAIVSHATQAMSADEGALLLTSGGGFEVAALVPPVEGGRGALDGGGFVQTIAKMRRTLFVKDAQSSRLITEDERQRGNHSLLGSPLLLENDLLGVLWVGWKDLHVADAGQQRFLEIIAARAAQGITARILADQRDEQRFTAETLALELAEANVTLRGKQESLALLHELTNLANSSLSRHEISRSVLLMAEQRLGLHASVIFDMDDSADSLRVLAQTGFHVDAAAPSQLAPIDDQSLERLVRHGLSIVTHESDSAPEVGAMRLSSGVAEGATRWVALPLRKDDEHLLGVVGLAFLGQRPFDEDEISLYRSIAGLLGAAFENARVHREETAAQMKQAAEEERLRLARDLHDSITQSLFAAALKAEALTKDDAIPTHALRTAGDVHRLARGALAQMRSLLIELRSDSPEDVPIGQLLRNVAEATEGRSSVAVTLTLRGGAELPRSLHPAIYRIAQEALNNVVRHAKATRASIDLLVEPSHVQLLVQDDGCGFEPEESLPPMHFGLRSMRERATEAGAQLRLVTAPGEGTLVMFDWRPHEVPNP